MQHVGYAGATYNWIPIQFCLSSTSVRMQTQEDEVPGGGDGSMNGLRLFHCLDRHGLFLPVTMIKRDTRFSTSQNSDSSRLPELDSMLQKFALSNG